MKKNKHYIYRPIKTSDANSLYELSKKASGGLSNLPKTLDGAKKIIKLSNDSFENKVNLKNKRFTFVVESNEKEVIGISAIKTRVGIKRPYYSFLVNSAGKYPTLELISQRIGPSEIGSLFLSPDYRNQGVGRLLSLSRFLFVGSFENLFTNTIIAELRGFLYKNNASPFWNHIGKKFIDMSFNKADKQSVKDITFIDQNFPKKPIYLNLINPKIFDYLGTVHPFTEPAKRLLLSESFRLTNHIDIFDGGPKLECTTKKIRTIKESKKTTLNGLKKALTNESFLVCNQSYNNFRCMKVTQETPLKLIKQELHIQDKDPILYVKERS